MTPARAPTNPSWQEVAQKHMLARLDHQRVLDERVRVLDERLRELHAPSPCSRKLAAIDARLRELGVEVDPFPARPAEWSVLGWLSYGVVMLALVVYLLSNW